MNFQQIAPLIGACITTGGLIFHVGKQAEKLDVIGIKVEAQEKKGSINYESIFEILGTVNLLKNDTENIKQDIHEIKEKLYKIK